MVRAYDALKLADVDATIAFYLRHQDAVNEYVRRGSEQADRLQEAIESNSPRLTREVMLARQAKRVQSHAAARG